MAFKLKLNNIKDWDGLTDAARWVMLLMDENNMTPNEDQAKKFEEYQHSISEKLKNDPGNKNMSLTRMELWLLRNSRHPKSVYTYEHYVKRYAPPPIDVPYKNVTVVCRRTGFMVLYELCMNTPRNPNCKGNTCKYSLRCLLEGPGRLNVGDIKYLGKWREHVSWMKL